MAGAHQSLRIFISYARSDASAFAEELMAGLEAAGFDPFLDQHDIVPGEDWQARLDHLLQQADTIAYVITPASVASERCAWELARAKELAKRVLPVVSVETDEAQTPEALRRLNYIYFTRGRSFGAGLKQLTTALRTDIDWIREHTRLGDMAARWRERSNDESLLMRGAELDAAQTWLAAWKPGAPEPTASQREFISASEAAETSRNNEQRKQLDKLIAVQRSRARLLVGLALVSLIAIGAVGGLLWNSQRQLQEQRRQFEITEQNFLNEIAGLQASAPVQPGAASPGDARQAPAPAEQAIEQSAEQIQNVIQQTRDSIGWRIDVFTCEGVAGARQKAERVVSLLEAEQRRQRESAGQLGVHLRSARLRVLTAAVNQRPGYRVSQDEIRGEAGEAEQVGALRAFLGREGVAVTTRQSSTLTANYLSVFICAPQ